MPETLLLGSHNIFKGMNVELVKDNRFYFSGTQISFKNGGTITFTPKKELWEEFVERAVMEETEFHRLIKRAVQTAAPQMEDWKVGVVVELVDHRCCRSMKVLVYDEVKQIMLDEIEGMVALETEE